MAKSRAAPLAGFEHDHAYRAAAEAHVLEYGEHATLGGVEAEWHVGACELVLDAGAAHGPVFEVVGAAEALPGRGVAAHGGVKGVFDHSLRNPGIFETGDGGAGVDADAVAALARDGVGLGGQQGRAASVFFKERKDVGSVFHF